LVGLAVRDVRTADTGSKECAALGQLLRESSLCGRNKSRILGRIDCRPVERVVGRNAIDFAVQPEDCIA